MDDATELALVVKALTSGLSNCVEWYNDRTAERIRNDPALFGLTPEEIVRQVFDFARAGGTVRQMPESRPEYRHYRFYYKAIVPLVVMPKGLFVEMILADDDPDVPVVNIVNAHPQR